MPEGTRCSTVFLPPITSVCPALCPPWKRTTPWAWSVSQSTTLPFPSSPHWVPMTTTFLATVSALAQIAHGPLAAALYELALAFGLSALRRVSRKSDHDDLPRASQLADRRGELRIAGVRRANGGRLRLVRRDTREIAQIHAESGRGAGASERLPDLVVTSAERDRVGHARCIGRKHHSAVVVISAKVRQIEGHGDSVASGKNLEVLERRVDFWIPGQRATGAVEHRAVSIELRKGEQCLARRFRHGLRHHAQRRQILGFQRFIQFRLALGSDPAVPANSAEHGDVADIEARTGNTAGGERLDQKLLDLQIALYSGVAVDFSADLQGLPGRVESPRPGEQDTSRVAQPRHAFPVQKVCIDPRDLGCNVGAHAHHPPGKLVHQLEGAKVQIMPCSSQQRFEVLEHRRNHQLVPVHAEQLEQLRAHPLDALRPRRQDVLEIFREEPVAHREGLEWPSGGETGSAGRPTSTKARKNGSVRQ